jgi:hypothetical protein
MTSTITNPIPNQHILINNNHNLNKRTNSATVWAAISIIINFVVFLQWKAPYLPMGWQDQGQYQDQE